MCVFQRGNAKCVFRLSGHITAVKTLSFCPSGLALVSGGIGGVLNIWSLRVSQTLLFGFSFISFTKLLFLIVNTPLICSRMVQSCRLWLQEWAL